MRDEETGYKIGIIFTCSVLFLLWVGLFFILPFEADNSTYNLFPSLMRDIFVRGRFFNPHAYIFFPILFFTVPYLALICVSLKDKFREKCPKVVPNTFRAVFIAHVLIAIIYTIYVLVKNSYELQFVFLMVAIFIGFGFIYFGIPFLLYLRLTRCNGYDR